ncbi:MAG: energy-coupled thiamine transporter ThiT [Fretibacterium sp.]|uniref:energy-coupled thiamine transporter ThiT n=1 Tax=Fretibacterium sp. OH1220_COT-178 TaxID=2491047 RepID=UPI000F5D7B3C|nr:energy-coupled thiamine transporter ThiT [Fretibacterium sp. OH1220_COT-178]MDO4787069.1 energy-coupled thiamine transporter ThiT [Fretibacterium sp.]RRD63807.1 energy-coupled thiamine transporter ThiT [Fretibacterium sp. OH1220_COT-178]
MSRSSRTVILVEGALCIALSVVLSYIRLFRLPQGGSVNLELVPLILFAWRRGLFWGCGAGVLAGVLNLLLGGYVTHPVQAVLDYPAAYGAMGLAALFPRQKLSGLLVAALAQFACHLLSGAIFFASYAPEGTNPWVYSAVYNGSFLAPKVILSAVVTWFLLRKLERIHPARGQ